MAAPAPASPRRRRSIVRTSALTPTCPWTAAAPWSATRSRSVSRSRPSFRPKERLHDAAASYTQGHGAIHFLHALALWAGHLVQRAGFACPAEGEVDRPPALDRKSVV